MNNPQSVESHPPYTSLLMPTQGIFTLPLNRGVRKSEILGQESLPRREFGSVHKPLHWSLPRIINKTILKLSDGAQNNMSNEDQITPTSPTPYPLEIPKDTIYVSSRNRRLPQTPKHLVPHERYKTTRNKKMINKLNHWATKSTRGTTCILHHPAPEQILRKMLFSHQKLYTPNQTSENIPAWVNSCRGIFESLVGSELFLWEKSIFQILKGENLITNELPR